MFIGEYGNIVQVNALYDLSAFTDLSIEFIKPNGETVTVESPDVTAPAVDIPGFALPNQYFQYAIAPDLINQVGAWQCRGVYRDAQRQLKTGWSTFNVEA